MPAVLPREKHAPSAPTANDDASTGLGVGSVWIDTTPGDVYHLVDSTAGAAVWQRVTGRADAAVTITAGNGLTGGGDLSANRTLAVAAADATITVNADSIQVGTVPVAQVSGAVKTTSAPGLPSSTATATRNLTGTVAIAETATSAGVTFGTAESDANYGIVASVDAISGSPVVGSLSLSGITSKATTGFTLNVATAPGAGTSVTYRWVLVR